VNAQGKLSQTTLLQIASTILLIDRNKYTDILFGIFSQVANATSCLLEASDAVLFLRYFIAYGYPDYSTFCKTVWNLFVSNSYRFESLNPSEQAILVEALGCAK
jgi:hypothetical protein